MKYEVSQKIAQRVRSLRIKAGFSQEKLSLEMVPMKNTSIRSNVKVNREYISKIETYKRNISIVNLERVCEALNITLFEFFNNKTFK
jgi:transcriptional regulator with XRE-family HTH domain